MSGITPTVPTQPPSLITGDQGGNPPGQSQLPESPQEEISPARVSNIIPGALEKGERAFHDERLRLVIEGQRKMGEALKAVGNP